LKNSRSTNSPLANFLVRPEFGSSTKLTRMRALEDLPAPKRLLAFILRKDVDGCQKALAEAKEQQLDDSFLSGGAASHICTLVYNHILELGIADELEQIELEDGSSLLSRIREFATQSRLIYERDNELFLALADAIEELREHAVWLKGTALARSLYDDPACRLSQDFDILIEPGKEQAVVRQLISNGFSPVWDNPGECHQFGVGPIGSLEEISLSPSKEFEFCHNLSFTRIDWPYVELKFDPLDRGLRTNDLNGFFKRTEWISWQGRDFKVPSIRDHLALSLTHFHKHGFVGWQWLYDIHLLASALNKESWNEVVSQCEHEGIDLSAWAGLELSRDRLGTDVPQEVIDKLSPKKLGALSKVLTFTINTEFLWNSASLPMLLLNAAYLGDGKRKMKVLKETLFPSKSFLSKYYLGKEQMPFLLIPACLFIHWLVVLLPAGVVRRTFGLLIWRSSTKKLQQEHSMQNQSRKQPTNQE